MKAINIFIINNFDMIQQSTSNMIAGDFSIKRFSIWGCPNSAVRGDTGIHTIDN